MRAISVSATNVRIGGDAKPARGIARGKQDGDFLFVPAWGLNAAAVERQAQEFWRRLNLIHESDIEPRTKQLCAVAYAGGEVVAVATAEPLVKMRLRFLHYRCAVSTSCRRHEMAWRLTAFAHNLLEQWFLSNPQEKIVGLLAKMEAREFAGHLGAPILPKHGLNLVFVGHAPDGCQFRAMWFKHANVEDMFQRTFLNSPDASAAAERRGV